ncbi:MAG TPA: glycine cleavage system protein H [Thermoanaerobaculia bacterium]|nr:glycine cleavage system protein H [Thermoanaerobaculia bacterium]
MIILLVILTFATAILIDHLLLRRKLVVVSNEETPQPARPRVAPAIVAGFNLPDNLAYHPGHTWAAAEGPTRVRIGIDDLAAKLAGDIETIEIPERGRWIRQGQKIIAMHRDGREIDLVSPMEGEIIDINEFALRNPNEARNDPYGNGWLLTVNAPDAKTNFRNLLGGTLARRWMDDAAARLRALVPATAATAQEGGVAVSDLAAQIPDADFDKVAKELFL